MTPRRLLTPYLRGNAWWARVPVIDGDAVRRPLGIYGKENKTLAYEACQFLVWLRNRRNAFLLDAIRTGKTTAGKAFSAYADNRLDAFVSELRDGATDTDLEPYVAKWQKELERRKTPNADGRAKYLKQVRTLIPEGEPFKRSTFTTLRIIEWLDGRDIGQPNRYRAALSSFASYLTMISVLPANPVSSVPSTRENDPRTLHLIQLDAKKLVGKMEDGKLKAFHCAMLATGMEFGAARRIDPATVTESNVYAHGTKTSSRQRTATIYDRWQWAWTIAREYIEQHADGSFPFGTITYDESRAALKRALKAAALTDKYTQHDHRHTWAVQAIRDGIDDYVIAHQLGHGSVTMIRKVYGRYRPTAADFTRKRTPSDTADMTNNLKSEDVNA